MRRLGGWKGIMSDDWILNPRTHTLKRPDSTKPDLQVHMQTDRQTDVLKSVEKGTHRICKKRTEQEARKSMNK